MSKRKQISASKEHPVIMYGYLKAQNQSEHERCAELWQRNFTASLDGEANEQFSYDRIVMLRNVNIRAFTHLAITPDQPLDDMPIFHGGAVFMKGDYPTLLFLFEEMDDMIEMVNEYPYDSFVLKNGEPYLAAAKRRRIRFSLYDGKEGAEYPPEAKRANIHFEGCEDGELMDRDEVTAKMLGDTTSSIVSLPGWPNADLYRQYMTTSAQIIERELEGVPEMMRDFYRRLYANMPATTPTIYKIPLPGIDYSLQHIAATAIGTEDHSKIIMLIQSNLVVESGLRT